MRTVTDTMPACQGTSWGPSPQLRKNNSVKFCNGDLWLCFLVKIRGSLHRQLDESMPQSAQSDTGEFQPASILLYPVLTYVIHSLDNSLADLIHKACREFYTLELIKNAICWVQRIPTSSHYKCRRGFTARS